MLSFHSQHLLKQSSSHHGGEICTEMELPFPEFGETRSALSSCCSGRKMSPENSGEVLYKQHAILREKGSPRAQQSWQLHGTGSGLCGEEVGTVEFRRDVGQKCLGNIGQHRNAFQCQVQKDNSHCLFRQRAKVLLGAEGHGGCLYVMF